MVITVTPNPAFDRTVEVEGFHVGGTFRGRLLARRAAGKGINVARCITALGGRSLATGLLARSASAAFAEELGSAGVEADFVGIDGEIRFNTTLIDPLARSETHVRERGCAIGRTDAERLIKKVAELAQPGQWVAICGSIPEGMSAGDLAAVIAAAHAKLARVALDSSGEGLRAASIERPDLLKPNRAELAELWGKSLASRQDALYAAKALAGKVAMAMLVTLGEEGALYVDERVCLAASCEPEEVINSVGSGDAALAGWLWAECNGHPPEERLRAAVAAGAAKLAEKTAGALDRERFMRLMARARVMRL